jgi:hypothetical protein
MIEILKKTEKYNCQTLIQEQNKDNDLFLIESKADEYNDEDIIANRPHTSFRYDASVLNEFLLPDLPNSLLPESLLSLYVLPNLNLIELERINQQRILDQQLILDLQEIITQGEYFIELERLVQQRILARQESLAQQESLMEIVLN